MGIRNKFLTLTVCLFLSVIAAACTSSSPQNSSSSTAGDSGLVPNSSRDSMFSEELKGKASFDQNFEIVFDDSGSMNDRKCGGKNLEEVEVSPGKLGNRRVDVAKWSNKKFVNEAVPIGVNLGFAPLNNKRQNVPLGKDNREQILTAIDNMDANGGTPLNGSLREATDRLIEQRNLQLGYGEYYIVVVTDGEATDGGGEDARRGAEYALKHDVMIITIGFCLPNHHALGQYSISSRNAVEAEELFEALSETQAELKEYTY